MKKQIEEIISQIRPMLERDGGSIDLIDVDETKGVVKVKLTGACGGCPHAALTLKTVVERMIKENVEGVKEVVAA